MRFLAQKLGSYHYEAKGLPESPDGPVGPSLPGGPGSPRSPGMENYHPDCSGG